MWLAAQAISKFKSGLLDRTPIQNDEYENQLKFGDTISLYSGEGNGYMIAEGFSDRDCKLVPSTKTLIQDFYACVFRVCPRFKYDAQKQYNEVCNNATLLGASNEIHVSNDTHKLRDAAVTEMDENIHECQNVAGQTVVYGQVVQLQHVKSGHFVTISVKEMANLEKDCLKVVLEPDGAEGSWFIVSPRFKMRSEGEPVSMGDQIILESKRFPSLGVHLSQTESESEINASTAASGVGWRVVPYSHYSPREEDFLKAGDTIRLFHQEVEAYLLNDSEERQLFEKNARLTSSARRETEEESDKSSDDGSDSDSSQGSLSRSGSSFDLSSSAKSMRTDTSSALIRNDSAFHLDRFFDTNAQSFEKVCLESAKRRTNYSNSNSVWEVEFDNNARGGVATYEKLYRLRHVATGKYLTSEDDDSLIQSRSTLARTQPKLNTSVPQISLANIMEDSGSKSIKLATCDNPNTPNTLFSFHPITLGSSLAESIKFNSFVRIRHHKSQCWLHAEQEILCTRKGEEETLNIVGVSSFEDKDAFAVIKTKHSEVASLYSLQGRLRDLKAHLEHAKRRSTSAGQESAPLAQARSSDKILQQLILQVNPVKHADLGTISYETLKSLYTPVSEIQHLFREQGLIDILIQYLYLTLANDDVKLEEIKSPENHALLALCRYINILLRLIFVDNQLNKNYASKYAMLIQGNIALSIKGTSTYIELIKDNKNLLKRISDIQIRTLINKIAENKAKSNRYFTLLSSMCTCLGKSVSRNQNMIARMILDNNEALIMLKLSNEDSLTDRLSATSFLTRSNLFSPRPSVPQHEKTVSGVYLKVMTPNKEWTELTTYLTNNPKLLDYTTNFISLLADLCSGGNVTTGTMVLRKYNLLLALAGVADNQLPVPIRISMGKLIFASIEVNIKQGTVKQVSFINYTRVRKRLSLSSVLTVVLKLWSNLQQNIRSTGNDTILTQSSMSSFMQFDLEKLKTFIFEYLHRGQDKLLSTVLSLCQQVFSIGLFTHDDVTKLLPFLLSIISDPSNDEESKETVCTMLDYFYDYRIDRRLTYLLEVAKSKMLDIDSKTKKYYEEATQFDDETSPPVKAVMKEHHLMTPEYLSLLMNLVSNSSTSLSCAAANLLIRNFTQEKELLKSLSKIQILADEKFVAIYTQIRQYMSFIRKQMATEFKRQLYDLKDILKQMTNLAGDVYRSHLENQKIFNHLKAHDAVVKIMKVKKISDRTEVLNSCLEFLKRFCRNNPENQEKMFGHFDFLLENIDDIDLTIKVCELLNTIVHNNRDICLQITEVHVRKILNQMSKVKFSIYVEVLHTILTFNNIPLRRNQILLSNLLAEKQKSVLIIYDNPELVSKRNKMMQECIYRETNSEMQYCVKLVELFAVLCQGKIYEAEIKCQSIFDMNAIVEQISDMTNWAPIRGAFLSLFLDGFLDTERKIKHIENSSQIWRILQSSEETLRLFIERTKAYGPRGANKDAELAEDVYDVSSSEEEFSSDESMSDSYSDSDSESGSDSEQSESDSSSEDEPDSESESKSESASASHSESEDEDVKSVSSKSSSKSHSDSASASSDESTKGAKKKKKGDAKAEKEDKDNATAAKRQKAEEKQREKEAKKKAKAEKKEEKERLKKQKREERQRKQEEKEKAKAEKMKALLERRVAKQLRPFIFTRLLPFLRVYFDSHYSVKSKLDAIRQDIFNNIAHHLVELAAAMEGEFASKEALMLKHCFEAMKKKQLIAKTANVKPIDDLAHQITATPRDAENQEDRVAAFLGSFSAKKLLLKEQYLHASLKNFHSFCSTNLANEKESSRLVELFKHNLDSNDTAFLRKLLAVICSDNVLKSGEFNSSILMTLKALSSLLQDMIDKSSDTLAQYQNQLNGLGATQLIFRLISIPNNNIVHEVLSFGIALLHGGNKRVQTEILNTFKTNPNCDLFVEIRNRMRKLLDDLEERKIHSQKRERKNALVSAFGLGFSLTGKSIAEAALEQQTEEKQIKDSGYIQQILRFLQLLCEGHNLDLQSLLRLQAYSAKSVDLISETAACLESLEGGIDKNNIDIAIQLFVTLTEYCQGPSAENQIALSRTKLCESINYIWRLKTLNVDPAKINKLKESMLITLLSLLEGNSSPAIPRHILNTINFDELLKDFKLVSGFVASNLTEADEVDEHTETIINEGFLLYFLFKTLESFDSDNKLDLILQAIPKENFFVKSSASVEIVRNNNIERVYFRVLPVCHNLPLKSKEDLIRQVNRETQKTKIQDFYERSEDLLEEMGHREKLAQNSLFSRVAKDEQNIMNASLLLSIFINLSITFSDAFNTSWLAFFGLLLLGLLQIGGAILIFYVNLMSDGQLELRKRCKDRGALWEEFDFKDPKNLLLSASHLLNAGRVPFYFCYVLCAVLGVILLPMGNPYFFAFHLLDLVVRNALLKQVIRSVTVNIKSIMLTLLLSAVVLYIYAIMGFLFFRDDFIQDDQLICQSMAMCLVTVFNYGLRTGGGLGGLLAPRSFVSPQYSWRLVYDLSFFILVIVILLKLIFGIIIDTFQELRAENQMLEEDNQNRCFTCGIQRDVFERQGHDFEHHIFHDHNLWHYLNFNMYLRRKDRTEYTGPEQYVADKIAQKDYNFVPTQKALCLDLKFEEEKKIKEVAEEVSKYTAQIRQHFAKYQQILDTQNEAIEKKIDEASSRHGSPMKQFAVTELENAIDNRIATLDKLFDKLMTAARKHPKLSPMLN